VIVLGFDTATALTAVAVTHEGEPLHAVALPPGDDGRPRHAEDLLPEVERAATAAGGWPAVDRIGVGVGPGSFTGMRIGIATARALATSLGVELAPVGSLDALAAGARDAAAGRPLLAAIDARRTELFVALHGAGGERLWEPLVAPPAELAERLARLESAPLAIGDGAVRFRRELEHAGADVPPDGDPLHSISAVEVCHLAERATPVPPVEVLPVYLREPDADRWRRKGLA